MTSVSNDQRSELTRYSATVAARSEERAATVVCLGAVRAVASERVIVGFAEGVHDAQGTLCQLGYEVVYVNAFRECVVRIPAHEDPFLTSQMFRSLEGVDYAEPDYALSAPLGQRMVESPMQSVDDDSALPAALAKTRAIDAHELLDVAALDPVRIAVLDVGVDTRHPDLADAVVGAYDALDHDHVQEPNEWDGHGTACAGLAAAAVNNTARIRGVAAGCGLLAVRVASTSARGRESYWETTSVQVARGIDWAWQNGADVLSNSWSYTDSSQHITNALGRALTMGRSGKGCVVVAAAGNDNTSVAFPANVTGVLAVSASNMRDEPKTPFSSDGLRGWGTNHGREVGIAAPGIRTRTTDITDAGGFNTLSGRAGDYDDAFVGTSAAAAIVAGAAALVIAANPALSGAEVVDVLKATAEKVSTVEYDANGHNEYMGYGRLDLLAAVQAAIARRTE